MTLLFILLFFNYLELNFSNWSGITDGCALNGVLDLNQCQQAPVVASFPHFYLADEKLKEYIEEGLHPDKNKHETFVEIEPVSILFYKTQNTGIIRSM